MDKTDYIWFNGKLVKWEDAKIHVLVHALHYGSAVFEGIRFYKTDKGPAVFRLKEHTARLLKSAKVFNMKIPFTQQQLEEATLETIRKNKIGAGYIRPIAFFGYGKMGLNPEGAPVDVAIAVWPWGSYLGEEAVKVKVSKYMRIHPKSLISDAKVSGHYVNSILASLEAKESGYQECLLLDYTGNIAEGPGENFFMIKKGKLYTPPLGNILPGITRDSIIKIARDLGHDSEEKVISVKDAKSADECFYTGTAAEVTGIKQIDETVIGNGSIGPITRKLKTAFLDVVQGRNKKYGSWLSYAK
ncbi:branched-chain amino acid transaminase [Candidatus Woesearchaeota archaeon]|nr:branched-chain amino acid transaminase [Candidatus Woesearchaeota archaeon]